MRDRDVTHSDGAGGDRPLETLTFAPLPTARVASAQTRDPAIQPGTRIDRYEVMERLGQGGMGVVFAATDPALGRRVAIKIVRQLDHASAEERHVRLFREARAMARLDHPNVVRVFDAGTATIDGREHAFIAMELVDGAPLEQWAAGRSWRERLRALIAAGRGLAAAHAAGLTHRDVKPENVLVDRTGRACIGDFGLAGISPLDRDASSAAATALSSPLTRTGTIMGTPAFMAPEQHQGGAADARTDQFGFCVTAWLTLFGQHPFDVTDLRTAVVNGSVRPPPRGEAPRWIEPLLRRGLEVVPARRHPSLTVVLDALERRLQPRRRWVVPGALAAAAAVVVPLWLGLGDEVLPAALAQPSCAAPELPALYVEATAARGGNGSAGCPFRTVTEALAVAAPARVIHVGAGRYDAAHGEALPLIIRGATELRGAGPDVTVIAGLGIFDPKSDGLAFSKVPVRATLVVGDHQGDVVLSGISVDGAQHEIPGGSAGIVCTRGNLHAFEGPVPPPNTRLERVMVGNGYETALVVTGGTSPALTGCNLSVSGGFFHDARVGIWQVGCGNPYAAAPTALHVENSAFRGLRVTTPFVAGDAGGVGLLVWDCASSLRVEDSQFTDSDSGIYVVRHSDLQVGAGRDPDEPPARIERNELASLGRYGLILHGAVQAELIGNTVYGARAAIAIRGWTKEPPQVRARRNALFGNGVAVEVTAQHDLPSASVIDFGRADDPGHNTFNCNADGNDGADGTIAIRNPLAPGAALSLFGNRWDHVPARVHRGRSTRDRVEVLAAPPAAAIDVGGAESTGDRCASE